MKLDEDNDLEIVMGGDSDIQFSEVGDIMNDLRPVTSKEKKDILIPVSISKHQQKNKEKENKKEKKDQNNKKKYENN